MAALTWREVAAPNFAGVNQANIGAGVTLDRALSGLSEGLKQFSTERQAGVDSSILARAMQIQDPDQLRKELTSGSLLQGVDLTRVNPKVLQTIDSRVGSLLNQAATEQGIVTSKLGNKRTQQDIDFSQYDQTRKVGQNQIEDAARPELARQLGLTGALAQLGTKDQQQVAQTNSGLASAELSRAGQRISNASGSFGLATRKRDDAVGQEAIGAAANAVSNNATIEGMRSDIENTVFRSPQAKMAAIAQAEKLTGQRLYSPVDAPLAAGAASGTKGNAPIGSGGGDVQSTKAKLALQEVGRRVAQNNSVGVVADIENNLSDTRSTPEIVQEIGKLYPEYDNDALTSIISEALVNNPNLSAADVGSAVKRSTTGNWLGSTEFADGVGVDRKTLTANLNAIAAGKADYMSADNQRTRAAGNVIKSADKSLADAKSDLIALQRRSQSQPNIDTSRAEERVQRAQQKLDDAIQRQQENPNFLPNYRKPEEAPKAKPIRVPR